MKYGRGMKRVSGGRKCRSCKGRGKTRMTGGLKIAGKKIRAGKIRGAAKQVLGSIEKQGGTTGKYAGVAKRLMSKDKKVRRAAVDDAVSIAFSAMNK